VTVASFGVPRKGDQAVYRSANVARERGYRDLDELIDYREYEGLWSLRFEELASAHANSSYAQVRVMVSSRSA
jgi:hypothetical protein